MSDGSDDYDAEVASVESEKSEATVPHDDSGSEIDGEELDDENVDGPDDDHFDIRTVSEYNNEINIVPADERMSRNVLSVQEMTAIVSIRAQQIQEKNNCLVDTAGLSCPIKMAMSELMARKCPLYVRRCVDGTDSNAYYEIWDPNKMTFATSYSGI
jgi:DNA-directed RNA polymerase subunit K/omega